MPNRSRKEKLKKNQRKVFGFTLPEGATLTAPVFSGQNFGASFTSQGPDPRSRGRALDPDTANIMVQANPQLAQFPEVARAIARGQKRSQRKERLRSGSLERNARKEARREAVTQSRARNEKLPEHERQTSRSIIDEVNKAERDGRLAPLLASSGERVAKRAGASDAETNELLAALSKTEPTVDLAPAQPAQAPHVPAAGQLGLFNPFATHPQLASAPQPVSAGPLPTATPASGFIPVGTPLANTPDPYSQPIAPLVELAEDDPRVDADLNNFMYGLAALKKKHDRFLNRITDVF